MEHENLESSADGNCVAPQIDDEISSLFIESLQHVSGGLEMPELPFRPIGLLTIEK